MKKQQAIVQNQQVQTYVQKNKLRALFSQLTKQLLLSRPQDPISYLISYLGSRPKRPIICIQGYQQQKRNKLATAVSNKYNFGLINLSKITGTSNYYQISNQKLCQLVVSQIKKVDKVLRGIIISGFPNNAGQADGLQKSGIIPQRYFVIQDDQPSIRQAYQKHYSQQQINLMIQRNTLQSKELLQLLGDQIDIVPADYDKAIVKISIPIGIRVKKHVPLEAPRVMILHPPFLQPKTLKNVAERYSFHWITVQKSFNKASKNKGFVYHVQGHIRQHKQLSKQIELALIQTQCKSASAKNKGALISGWPNKKSSLNFIKLPFIQPHLIIGFTCLNSKACEQFQKLDQKDSQIFTICEKPSIEQFKKLMKQYENIIQALKGSNNFQSLGWAQGEQSVIKTFQGMFQNEKIYS